MASHTCRNDFLHKWIVHKKFQLKIPTLSKNDCSATWKPNTNQKNFMQDQLRNVQRYQKYVPIFRAFFLTVSDQFKPTVNTLSFELYCMIVELSFKGSMVSSTSACVAGGAGGAFAPPGFWESPIFTKFCPPWNFEDRSSRRKSAYLPPLGIDPYAGADVCNIGS